MEELYTKIKADTIKYFSNSWISLPDKMPTNVLQELTNNIFTLIINDDPLNSLNEIQISKTIGQKNDMIEYFILDKLIFRHCIIYLVAQYSYNTNKLRIMAYGANIILHTSWGTSLELVDRDKLIKYIKEAIKEKFQYGSIKISTNLILLNKIMNNDYILFLDT